MTVGKQSHRGTIFLEDGAIAERSSYEGEQFVLQISAPETAKRARPGSFIHLTCDSALPMRRPLSIMSADPVAGTIEVLFKTHGAGLSALADQTVGAKLSLLGPIGKPFTLDPTRPHALAIGGGVGIPPMVFLAEAIRAIDGHEATVLMGSELPFPFEQCDSALPVAGVSAAVCRTMERLEQQGIAARLASLAGYTGALKGYVTDLARAHLNALQPSELDRMTIYACGPTPMLKAVASVAVAFDLPCQVSLEEYMACAVGGCAGCTVLVQDGDEQKMQRVCVDGPVFDSRQVFPDA